MYTCRSRCLRPLNDHSSAQPAAVLASSRRASSFFADFFASSSSTIYLHSAAKWFGTLPTAPTATRSRHSLVLFVALPHLRKEQRCVPSRTGQGPYCLTSSYQCRITVLPFQSPCFASLQFPSLCYLPKSLPCCELPCSLPCCR